MSRFIDIEIECIQGKFVAEAMSAIAASTNVPVSVKCRIGVDDHDSYDELCKVLFLYILCIFKWKGFRMWIQLMDFIILFFIFLWKWYYSSPDICLYFVSAISHKIRNKGGLHLRCTQKRVLKLLGTWWVCIITESRSCFCHLIFHWWEPNWDMLIGAKKSLCTKSRLLY